MTSTSKKLSISELLRLACIYAEQDRESFIDAMSRCANDASLAKAKEFLIQLREYRKKRWPGKTAYEELMDGAKEISLEEARALSAGKEHEDGKAKD